MWIGPNMAKKKKSVSEEEDGKSGVTENKREKLYVF